MTGSSPVDVLIVAVPETAGSALYGFVDVLSSAGNLWHALTGGGRESKPLRVRLLSEDRAPFECGNRIPVVPDVAVDDDPPATIIVLPELWLGPEETVSGRYPKLFGFVRDRYRAGANVYAACSGTVMLAETGLLDGCPATSHWAYQDLFRTRFPTVRFDPAPSLVYADRAGRIVTAGGTTSWHDLALHIIARHVSPGEAVRIAKIYLLKGHPEGQLPYTPLDLQRSHADAVVRRCEAYLREHFREDAALQEVARHAGVPERTLKRRFKAATGGSLTEYLQRLRVEAAKGALETSDASIDLIGLEVGYQDASFFRRVFKRFSGLTPSAYRKMFASMGR